MEFLGQAWTGIAARFELSGVAAALLGAMIAYRLLVFVVGLIAAVRRPEMVQRAAAARLPDRYETLDAVIWFVLVLYLFIRPQVATLVEVTTGAMRPTLQGSPTPQIDGPNDRVLVSRYLYRLRVPLRGEVVAIRQPEHVSQLALGRLLAVAGDRLRLDEMGHMHVNDAFVAAGDADQEPGLPILVVPEGHVLVLGDDEAHGRGAGRWLEDNYLKADAVVGKATAIVWPPDRIRLVD